MTLTEQQVALLNDVAAAIIETGYAVRSADSQKRIDVFLQDVDIEAEKFKRLHGYNPTHLELSRLLGISRSQLSRLINREPRIAKISMKCDTCGREKMQTRVGFCRKCGGWMRQIA